MGNLIFLDFGDVLMRIMGFEFWRRHGFFKLCKCLRQDDRIDQYVISCVGSKFHFMMVLLATFVLLGLLNVHVAHIFVFL